MEATISRSAFCGNRNRRGSETALDGTIFLGQNAAGRGSIPIPTLKRRPGRFSPMRNDRRFSGALFIVALCSVTLLTACGGGSGSSPESNPTVKSNPIFTSSAVTAASEGMPYSYQLAATDPVGGMVTFALTTAPTGAILNDSTVIWTPTAAQSRLSNSFTVTASTSSGGSATQSWTVTPAGTVTVNWVDTYWTAAGPVQVPAASSNAGMDVQAYEFYSDGGGAAQDSSSPSPGVFLIPNVPGGYYWLHVLDGNFWTSTNTFDAGRDIAGSPMPSNNDSQPTILNFNLSGLDSVSEPTLVEFLPEITGGYTASTEYMVNGPDSTTLSPLGFITTNIDWTQVNDAYLLQYLPASLGALNNQVLGASVDASLALTNDTNNTIAATLQQPNTRASVDLNIPGSQWAALFANAAPAEPSPYASAVWIAAEPYLDGRAATMASPLFEFAGEGPNVFPGLAGTTYQGPQGSQSGPGGPVFAACDYYGFPNFSSSSQPAITTDYDYGPLTYADPFPSAWTRYLSLCEEYTVAVPIPNSSATATFYMVDTAALAPSARPSLAPLVSTVQNATINGTSFFAPAAPNNNNAPVLSWSAPASGTPYGYTIIAYIQVTLPDGTPSYGSIETLNTAQTSVTVPGLPWSNTYVFSITAQSDALANMETSPYRSSLPTGSATILSAPITIGPCPANECPTTSAMPRDIKVPQHLSQPRISTNPH